MNEIPLPATFNQLSRSVPCALLGDEVSEILDHIDTLRAALVALKDENGRLPCGHHKSLLVESVESDYKFCDLCECRKQRNDAEQMERHYQERAEQAESRAADLAEKLKGAEANDRRYQWLRSENCDPATLFPKSAVSKHEHLGDDFGDLSQMFALEELDAAIDAAIQAASGRDG